MNEKQTAVIFDMWVEFNTSNCLQNKGNEFIDPKSPKNQKIHIITCMW